MPGALLQASNHFGQPAICDQNGAYTREDIFAKAAQMAARIQQGGGKGKRFLVPYYNAEHFMATLLGIHQADAVIVPCRQDSLADADYLHALLHPAGMIEESGAVQFYNASSTQDLGNIVLLTTGSTGNPKGVVLDLDQVVINCELAGARIGITDCDVWCAEVDLSFTSGLCHLLMAWINQVPFHHIKYLDSGARNALFAKGKIGFGGSPIQLSKLTDQLNAAPLKFMSSGDFLPLAIIQKIRAKFPNTEIHKFYGLTEFAGRFCSVPSNMLDDYPDAAGLPLPGFDVSVRNEQSEEIPVGETGQIWARSPLLMKGYIRQGQPFDAKKGWFNTRDIGFMNDAGLITLLGREDDVFKVGGEKVDRLSIENILAGIMPADYVVLPYHHESFGTMPVLFTADHPRLPDWQTVRAHVAAHLPVRFVPMQGFILPTLPRTATGKIERRALCDNISQYRRF
ncbi:MAG TPA: class I adenylate-forming enzyme family protein [Alphaproteobacteria bacterium]